MREKKSMVKNAATVKKNSACEIVGGCVLDWCGSYHLRLEERMLKFYFKLLAGVGHNDGVCLPYFGVSGRAVYGLKHTIWGYFSQRSGLLVKFKDSRLLSVRSNRDDGEGVFWETSTETVIEDYKYVEGVNVAHSGKTFVTVFRYGEQSANHKRELQESWKIEEVDFNVWGLPRDFFLPPSELTTQGSFH